MEYVSLESVRNDARNSHRESLGHKLGKMVDFVLRVKSRDRQGLDQLAIDLLKERGLEGVSIIPSSEAPPILPDRGREIIDSFD